MFFGVSTFSQLFGAGSKEVGRESRKRSSDEGFNEESPKKRVCTGENGPPVPATSEGKLQGPIIAEKKSVRFDEEVEVCEISRDTSSFQSSQNSSTLQCSILEDSQANTVLEERQLSKDGRHVRFDEEVTVNEISRDERRVTFREDVSLYEFSRDESQLEASLLSNEFPHPFDDGKGNGTERRVTFREDVSLYEFTKDESQLDVSQSSTESFQSFDNENDKESPQVREDVSLFECNKDDSQIDGSQLSNESFHSCTMGDDRDNSKEVMESEEPLVLPSSASSLCFLDTLPESLVQPQKEQEKEFSSLSLGWLNSLLKAVECESTSNKNQSMLQEEHSKLIFSVMEKKIERLLRAKTRAEEKAETAERRVADAEKQAAEAERRAAEAERKLARIERDVVENKVKLDLIASAFEISDDIIFEDDEEEEKDEDEDGRLFSLISTDSHFFEDELMDTASPSTSSGNALSIDDEHVITIDDSFNVSSVIDERLEGNQVGNTTPQPSKKSNIFRGNVTFKNTPEVYVVEKYIGIKQKENKKKGGSNIRKRQQRLRESTRKRNSISSSQPADKVEDEEKGETAAASHSQVNAPSTDVIYIGSEKTESSSSPNDPRSPYRRKPFLTVPEDISSIPNAKGVRCNQCSFMGRTTDCLRRHAYDSHPKIYPDQGLSGPGRESLISVEASCAVCEEVFTNRKQLESHAKSEHPQEKCLRCRSCSSVFLTILRVREHERRIHESAALMNKDDLKCVHCETQFTTKRNLDTHVKRHSNPRSYLKKRRSGKSF